MKGTTGGSSVPLSLRPSWAHSLALLSLPFSRRPPDALPPPNLADPSTPRRPAAPPTQTHRSADGGRPAAAARLVGASSQLDHLALSLALALACPSPSPKALQRRLPPSNRRDPSSRRPSGQSVARERGNPRRGHAPRPVARDDADARANAGAQPPRRPISRPAAGPRAGRRCARPRTRLVGRSPARCSSAGGRQLDWRQQRRRRWWRAAALGPRLALAVQHARRPPALLLPSLPLALLPPPPPTLTHLAAVVARDRPRPLVRPLRLAHRCLQRGRARARRFWRPGQAGGRRRDVDGQRRV